FVLHDPPPSLVYSLSYTTLFRSFFLMECADYEHNLMLYEWLIELPIFHNLLALPLQNRVICIVDIDVFTNLFRQLRIMSLEWERSEEHTSELQSRENLVCRLLLE